MIKTKEEVMSNYKYFEKDILDFLVELSQKIGKLPGSKDIEREHSKNGGDKPSYTTVKRVLRTNNIKKIHAILRRELDIRETATARAPNTPEQLSLF